MIIEDEFEMNGKILKNEFLIISALSCVLIVAFLFLFLNERLRRRVPKEVDDWVRRSPKGLTMFTSPSEVIEFWIIPEAKLGGALKMLESNDCVLLSKSEAEQISERRFAHSAGYYYLGRGIAYGNRTKVVGRLPNIGTSVVAGNDFRELRRQPVVFHILTSDFTYYVEFCSSGWDRKSGIWNLWGILETP